MTLRLLNVAISEWGRFNGWCVSQRVKPERLHPSDLCDLIYFWLVKDADQKSSEKVDMQLWMPPIADMDVSDHPMFSPEAELAAFEQSQKSQAKLASKAG